LRPFFRGITARSQEEFNSLDVLANDIYSAEPFAKLVIPAAPEPEEEKTPIQVFLRRQYWIPAKNAPE